MIVPALFNAERVRLSCEARPEGSMYRSEWLQPWFVKAFTSRALKAALENHSHEECAKDLDFQGTNSSAKPWKRQDILDLKGRCIVANVFSHGS